MANVDENTTLTEQFDNDMNDYSQTAHEQLDVMISPDEINAEDVHKLSKPTKNKSQLDLTGIVKTTGITLQEGLFQKENQKPKPKQNKNEQAETEIETEAKAEAGAEHLTSIKRLYCSGEEVAHGSGSYPIKKRRLGLSRNFKSPLKEKNLQSKNDVSNSKDGEMSTSSDSTVTQAKRKE